MSYPYDATFAIPFPSLPVVIRQIDGSAATSDLVALVDTGADVTAVPRNYLRMVQAEEAYTARIRSHWGESWPVSVYLVDLEIAEQLLPAVEVVGDDETEDILLGRNVLNKLTLLLDGPHETIDVLASGIVGLPTGRGNR